MRGAFVDDYGNSIAISDSLFEQRPHGRFHIVEWNAAERYVIARNDASNSSDPDTWTRIDWRPFEGMEPYRWGFCLTAYKAESREAARATPAPNRAQPRVGCNGYPYPACVPSPRTCQAQRPAPGARHQPGNSDWWRAPPYGARGGIVAMCGLSRCGRTSTATAKAGALAARAFASARSRAAMTK